MIRRNANLAKSTSFVPVYHISIYDTQAQHPETLRLRP